MAEESGIFPMSLVNSDLYTITYTPDPNADHRYCGSGLNENSQHLKFLSGPNLISSISEGVVCTNNDNTYWQNDSSLDDFSFFIQYDDFDVVFNNIGIIPTGNISWSYRYQMPGGHSMDIVGLTQLWAKKNHNPSLSGDILIAELDDTSGFLLGGSNIWDDDTREFTINEAGRSTWQSLIPDLKISLSGHLRHLLGNDFQLSGMELIVSGLPPAIVGSGINNSLNMYMGGHIANTGSFDMYLEAGAPSGYFPLYIAGHTANSGSLNMNLTGVVRSSGNFDMYMYGHQSYSNSVNMVVKAPTVGSGNSGPEMYMLGPSFLPYSGILPLYLHFDTSPNKSFDMFLQNNNVSSTGMISMFVQAPSGTYGAVPWSGILPMFIARSSEGIAESINMFINGPTAANSGFPMYIAGTNSLTNQFNMAISGGGPINSSINLYQHGF